jgi:hypothetical protein
MKIKNEIINFALIGVIFTISVLMVGIAVYLKKADPNLSKSGIAVIAAEPPAKQLSVDEQKETILDDLDQVKTALYLYSDDHRNNYPLLKKCVIYEAGCVCEQLVGAYLLTIPRPRSFDSTYYYCSISVNDEMRYAVWGTLESDAGEHRIIGIIAGNRRAPNTFDSTENEINPCKLIEK